MDKRLFNKFQRAAKCASVLVSQPQQLRQTSRAGGCSCNHKLNRGGASDASTEKGSENASPANPGATNPAKMTKLMKALMK